MDEMNMKKLDKIIKKVKNNSSYKFLRESMEIIGNEDRFLILNLLNKKSCLLSEIEEELNRSQSSLSHHVRILEENGFIHSSKQGKFKEYSISKEKFLQLVIIWEQWFNEIRTKK